MVEVDEEGVAGVVGVESEVDELGDELITGEGEVSWEEEEVVVVAHAGDRVRGGGGDLLEGGLVALEGEKCGVEEGVLEAVIRRGKGGKGEGEGGGGGVGGGGGGGAEEDEIGELGAGMLGVV